MVPMKGSKFTLTVLAQDHGPEGERLEGDEVQLQDIYGLFFGITHEG